MQQYLLDKLIVIAANALTIGLNKSEIRNAFLKKGWSEEEIYLAIKAGEIIFTDRIKFLNNKRS